MVRIVTIIGLLTIWTYIHCLAQTSSFNQSNHAYHWNDKTGTPHRVICNNKSLAEKINSEHEAITVIKRFINHELAEFNIDFKSLTLIGIKKIKRIFYINYRQTFEGLPIENSELIFRLHENGNLLAYGVDYHRNIVLKSQLLLNTKDILTSCNKEFADCHIYVDDEVIIYPIWTEDHYEYHRARGVEVTNGTNRRYKLWVDAHDGRVLKRENKICKAIHGQCRAAILPELSTDNQTLRNLSNQYVLIDGEEVLTDVDGNFNHTVSNSSATLVAELRGPYVHVQNYVAPNARIERTVLADENVVLEWNNSNSKLSERNVFYHINELHQYNKQVDPSFTHLDYPLVVYVEDNVTNTQTCNAYWNGTNLFFNVQGVGCSMNSAHGASVIYHEYGHAMNDRIYNQMGDQDGLNNHILHEAFADITSCLLLNESRFALGWLGPNTFTRNLNNSNTYPTNIVGQQHTDGLILGGAFWDLAQSIGPEKAYELAHFAKYGLPDNDDIGVAFAEVYMETLIADDDDGNLWNGSPNSNEIEQAFCAHGIGSNLFIIRNLRKLSYHNIEIAGVDVSVDVKIVGPSFSHSDIDELELIYSVDNFSFENKASFTELNDSIFRAMIPGQESGTVVKYYFAYPDGSCGRELKHPSRDHRNHYYSFLVGDFEVIVADSFEEHKGWTFGTPADNAVAGRWQRANPQEVIDGLGYILQPGEDFSVNGQNCLVTGFNRGAQWYSNDVDGGKTTVTSPVYTGLEESSVVEFYKWFVHGAAFVFPAQGEWTFEASNNGTNWIEIEKTRFGEHREWVKAVYRVSDFLPITQTMQFRFIADDSGTGSIVEALVDNFKIMNVKPISSVQIESREKNIEIWPNPSTGTVTLHLARPLTKTIPFEIYSLTGDVVNKGLIQKGERAVRLWFDESSKGVFIIQLEANNKFVRRKILIY